MLLPLVSVICLCYNHQRFVRQAIDSVIGQTYKRVEVIVVDDASKDGSAEIIQQVLLHCPEITFIRNTSNLGNCAAFNRGLALANGKYIIDFATDDIMHQERVARQVSFFEALAGDVGVIFSNAEYINEDGTYISDHFKRDKTGKARKPVPEGDIYARLVSTYFISPPTMMMRRSVLDDLGGYDENLAYEDFDFWVRSSRKYSYAYQDECLTRVRLLKTSHSSSLYRMGDRKLYSTYVVCRKVVKLNRNRQETAALIKRVKYEFRHAVFTENHAEANLFFQLLKEEGGLDSFYTFLYWLNKRKLPLSRLRLFYHRLRYPKYT